MSRIPLFASLAVLAGCASDQPPSPASSVRDSAGIEIITNHHPLWQPGEEWRIENEPFLELGELEGLEPEMFINPAARLLSDGRLLVSEPSERELRMFSNDGQWLWTAGREGQGPGEFVYPQPAEVLPGDTILVLDSGTKRASWFDSSGEFIRSVRIDAGDRLAFSRGVLQPDVWLFEARLPASDSAGLTRWQSEVKLIDASGTPRATVDTLTTDLSLSESTDRLALYISLPFFARPIIAAGSGRAYITDNTSWEIRVFDRVGGLERIIRRTWAPRAVTDADVEEYISRRRTWGEEQDQTEGRIEVGLRLAEKGARRSSIMPAMYRFFVDRVGNLWTMDWVMPEDLWPESRFDVFDPDGIWLGEVTVPAGAVFSDVGDDYVLLIVSDELGIKRIRAHRLIKPNAGESEQDS